MGTVYAFFADGFEEIEAFTAVDTLRRAGLNVEIVSVTPDEIVMGAHDVSLLCDINFDNCDFFDADLLLLPEECREQLRSTSMKDCVNCFLTLLPKENRSQRSARLRWYWAN